MSKPWPINRKKELHELIDMILTIKTLNNGSGFTGRIQKIIEAAEKIDKLDLESAEPNFRQFLVHEAFGEGGES